MLKNKQEVSTIYLNGKEVSEAYYKGHMFYLSTPDNAVYGSDGKIFVTCDGVYFVYKSEEE